MTEIILFYEITHIGFQEVELEVSLRFIYAMICLSSNFLKILFTTLTHSTKNIFLYLYHGFDNITVRMILGKFVFPILPV